MPAAQAKGRERYEGFVEALGRRLARGRLLADEISRDIAGDGSGDAAAERLLTPILPAACYSTPRPDDPIRLVASAPIGLFLLSPDATPRLRGGLEGLFS